MADAQTSSNRPLWRLAWRRFQQRSGQYLLFIIGVALGVAMMVSIDLANGSAQRAFSLSTDAITGQATHRVVAVAPQGVDETVFTQLKRQLGLAKAAPIVEGYAVAPPLGNQPMRLVGVDLFSEAPFRTYFKSADPQDVEGFAQLITEPNTVVLSQAVANRYQVKLGQTLPLDFAGRTETVRVAGLLDPANASSEKALSNLIFADIATAQELLGMQGYLSHIDVIETDATNLQRIAAALPQGIQLETSEAEKNAVKQMTAAFELNLTALSLLALVVGMFLIYNTVTFSVVQRRPLFGTLRCLGVTPGQLFGTIMGEATVLSVIGSLLGVGLGIILGRAVVGLITQTINDFYFVVSVQQVTLSSVTLIKGLVLGIAASLLAALVPAVEAMRTSPTGTLQRSTLESQVSRLIPWLVVAWALISILGVGLLRLQQGGLIAAFGGLFAILLSTALLTPALIQVLMRGVTPLTNALFGVIGRMAPRDIVRSLSRTSVAIAALMLAVSVIVGVSIMIGSFRGTVVQWLDQTLQADIYIAPPSTTANRVLGKLASEVVTAVQRFPDLADVITYNDTDGVVTAFNEPLEAGTESETAPIAVDRRAKLISADGDVSHGKRPYAWKSVPNVDPWEDLAAGKGVIVSEALLLKENFTTPPQSITLETPQGPRTFAVIAVFYDYSSDQGTVILDNDLYLALWGDDTIASLAAFVPVGVSVEDQVQALQTQFQGRSDVVIQSNQALRQVSLDIFDRTFAITQALRLLAVIVAFIGVLSALLSLQLERTREIGILRANGMTPQQLWSMTLLETGLMGAVAGLIAMPLGYVLAWILIYVINVRSFGWTLQMQLTPGYFWQAAMVAIAAALLAGLYPAWSRGRMIIASAVREE